MISDLEPICFQFNEEDTNGDGILDKLEFQVQIEKIGNVNSIFMVLVFDVVLQVYKNLINLEDKIKYFL